MRQPSTLINAIGIVPRNVSCKQSSPYVVRSRVFFFRSRVLGPPSRVIRRLAGCGSNPFYARTSAEGLRGVGGDCSVAPPPSLSRPFLMLTHVMQARALCLYLAFFISLPCAGTGEATFRFALNISDLRYSSVRALIVSIQRPRLCGRNVKRE